MDETAEQEAVSLAGDARGKHRILAELGRVEQEVRFLERILMMIVSQSRPVKDKKELEELEQSDIVSTVCEELICVIEKDPDPLLPLTRGPFNLAWDRWFEGPNGGGGGGGGCRCFIL